MLRNALKNKGFPCCPADGDRFMCGVIAAAGGSRGDSAGAAGTYGDFSRKEADQ